MAWNSRDLLRRVGRVLPWLTVCALWIVALLFGLTAGVLVPTARAWGTAEQAMGRGTRRADRDALWRIRGFGAGSSGGRAIACCPCVERRKRNGPRHC